MKYANLFTGITATFGMVAVTVIIIKHFSGAPAIIGGGLGIVVAAGSAIVTAKEWRAAK